MNCSRSGQRQRGLVQRRESQWEMVAKVPEVAVCVFVAQGSADNCQSACMLVGSSWLRVGFDSI